MSTPQNPYGPDNGSGNQNPNGQNPNGQNGGQPNGPGYGGDQNGGQSGGQASQYGSPNEQDQSFGSQPAQPQYGQQPPQYGQQDQQGQQQYGSQPQYGQHNDGGAQYDQNQYGQNPYYDQNQYGQNPGYDANAQGYDANQYGQQPAYAGADGGSDQFTPANPNAGYGQFPPVTGGNTSKNIWGILALIGGIVGILLSFVFGAGFLFGAAAVVFGFVGLSAVKKGTASNKGLSITGIVLGIISVLLSIIVVVALILGIGLLGKAASDEASKSAGISTSGASDPAQDPSDPAQDPSQGAGDSEGEEAAPVEGGEVTIGDDLTAAVQVRPGTADQYASGAESSNGEIAIVTMTIKNASSSDVELTLATLTASDGNAANYQDVFDGSKYKGSLAFADPVPAEGERTYEFAFGVPSSDVDGMHLKLSLIEDLGSGTDFEFSKQ